jgi:hypothetical protein
MRTQLALLAMVTAGPVIAQNVPVEADREAAKPYADKLIHAPTPLPDRVILTWNGDPATSMAVTWRTDTSVTAAVAQIAAATDGPEFDPINPKDSKPGDKVTTVPAVTTLLKTDLSVVHYHSATFTGLKPKSKYVYRVGDPGRRNWGEWHQFETADDKPAPVGIVYFGDAQNDVKRHWSRVVRGAYSDMPKATFLLHAGDLINRATSDAEWGEWHAAAGWINGCVPSLPTPGNHEYGRRLLTDAERKAEAVLGATGGAAFDPARPVPAKASLTAHWRAQFTLPENGPPGFEESCYFVDVQGVRVVSLNSNERHAEQVDWLRGVLKDNPNKWTVVTFHHPVYATAATRQKEEEGKAVRKWWRPVLDELPPDLVLQGHDHSYGRSGLMHADNVLDGMQAVSQKGTVYCVSVSGPKMYELGQQPWMVSSGEKKQLYQLVRIDGDRLHYASYTAAGKLYDEFELRKRKDKTNLLVERETLEKERKERGADLRRGDAGGNGPAIAVGGMGVLAVGALGLRWAVRRKGEPRV